MPGASLARAVAALGDEDAGRLDEAVRERRRAEAPGVMMVETTTSADGTVRTRTAVSRRVRYLQPQVATVPLNLDARPSRARPGSDPLDDRGPFMVATASRLEDEGRLEVLVYAYQADVALMDLSFLHLAGGPCELGPWKRWDGRDGINGPILRPEFALVPGPHGYEVELNRFMPVVAERTVTRVA